MTEAELLQPNWPCHIHHALQSTSDAPNEATGQKKRGERAGERVVCVLCVALAARGYFPICLSQRKRHPSATPADFRFQSAYVQEKVTAMDGTYHINEKKRLHTWLNSRPNAISSRVGGHRTPPTGWLNDPPKVKRFSRGGQFAPSIGRSNACPNVKCSRSGGHRTPVTSWLKLSPSSRRWRLLGKATSRMGWLKLRPRVSWLRPRGHVTLSTGCRDRSGRYMRKRHKQRCEKRKITA